MEQTPINTGYLNPENKNLHLKDYPSRPGSQFSQDFQFDKMSESDYYNQVSQTPSLRKSPFKAFILEDDPASNKILTTALHNLLGSDVDSFTDPQTALRALENNDYDLLILDWNFPFSNGEEFLLKADKIQKSKVSKKTISTIICTCNKLNDIRIPNLEFFIILDFWNKSMPFSSVVSSIELAAKKVTDS